MKATCYSINVTEEELERIMDLMDADHRFTDRNLLDMGVNHIAFPLNKEFSKKLILRVAK